MQFTFGEGCIEIRLSSDDWSTEGGKIHRENAPFKAKDRKPPSKAFVRSISVGCHVGNQRYELTCRTSPDVVSKWIDQELTRQHDVPTHMDWNLKSLAVAPCCDCTLCADGGNWDCSQILCKAGIEPLLQVNEEMGPQGYRNK